MNRRRNISVSALLLLVLLLQPAAAFAAQVFKSAETMSCCRRKAKDCCCRKDGKQSAAPKWKAVPACEESCGASARTVPSISHFAAPQAAWTAMDKQGPAVIASEPAAFRSSYLAFLYVRPPPPLI